MGRPREPVEQVEERGSVRAVPGAGDPAQGALGGRRAVPGGANGDARGNFEARAGAAGEAAVAGAGGGASGVSGDMALTITGVMPERDGVDDRVNVVRLLTRALACTVEQALRPITLSLLRQLMF